MALVNTMEEIVMMKIDALLEEIDGNCCTCEKCREDMACIALNSLPAKYVSTAKGKLFSKLSQTKGKQNTVDVNVACLNAIEYVKAHPQHDEP